ncbi:S1C family serine protease [Nocardioides terrisoli]|uniref:S1C family serine protease n=1 Tax=Nocardioides terrisoli TaxID=3388267 RepID=UPI00287BB802|nr:trypsin-like peptidase domain-containing protein [Nocardioides marmorisolisilvae]
MGGAAGVGGAAWYDAWQGDDNSSVSASSPASGNVVSATDDTAKAGSVEQVAAKVLPSVVKINVTGQNEAGSGSGIILKPDGTILTNNHVVAVAGNNGSITVNFNDGSTHRAKVVGTDPVTDIAVIKAENVSDLTPATIGHSGNLKVGQPVVAVGSPFGLNSTVTSGIVSALNRPVSVQTSDPQQQTNPFSPFGAPQSPGSDQSTTYPAIQTDAAINPGNSGGPLVDMAGRVVGIDSAIRTSGTSASGEGGSIGLGFAIPIDEVLPIVNQIMNHQTPTHARLGVSVSDLTGRALQQGAKIHTVDPNGAASGVGLKAGDVITKVDNTMIDGADSLVATIRGHRPGDNVKITYIRGGSSRTVSVTLGSDQATKSS